MQQALSWVLVSIASLLLAGAGVLALLNRRRARGRALPTDWALAPRPVFSGDERRVHRQLCEALPHHVVLSKLPLVRFCQPTDPGQVRYWYELLGALHVTFAICSANGRVLAAVDLESERGPARRALQIKTAVLGACRIRYLRCPVDHLPSIPELQLLVPNTAAATRGPLPAPVPPRREGRRRERATLWRDSGFFQDSFFGAETRSELGTDFGVLRSRTGHLGDEGEPRPVRH